MFVDSAISPRPARTSRRSPRRTDADRLGEALIALAGGHGAVVAHDEQPWASVTFAGVRHRITLQFTGADAIEGGEAMIAQLPEHEFTLPRQLVADAAVCAVKHALLPAPNLNVTCELLLVEDC